MTDQQAREIIGATAAAPFDTQTKVIRLFAWSMIYYRHQVGDLAQTCIRDLIGAEACSALYFLTGASHAGGGDRGWGRLIPEIGEDFDRHFPGRAGPAGDPHG